MNMWELLLLVGAISTILNFVMNIIGTVLAIRRTRMQTESYKWKRKKYEEKKNER
jgi:hypothetical protein